MTVEHQHVSGQDEIASLRSQLEELRKRKNSLRSSFNQTFDEVGIGIAHVDLDGRFIDLNSTFCQMLDYKSEALVGKTFADFTFSEDVDLNLEYLAAVRNGELASYRMDKRYRRANGDFFWADLVVKAHLGSDGRPSKLISAITDITGRKELEDRQNFLIGELAHRTSNLVSVVKAITRQTARTAETVEVMATTLCSRLSGIAASQTALASTDNQNATSVMELCRLQLATFLSPEDPRTSLLGPEFRLAPAPSRAIGMAIHELTTNAIKYGALSLPGGIVAISWRLLDADSFEIAWQEAGGPIVAPPTRTGFGRKVIEHMVAASTNGEVRIDYNPSGLSWY